MFFLEITEVLVSILVLTFLLTQIIYPILVNKPLFPLFRSKNSELDKALAEAKAEYDNAVKKGEIEDIKHLIKEKTDGPA